MVAACTPLKTDGHVQNSPVAHHRNTLEPEPEPETASSAQDEPLLLGATHRLIVLLVPDVLQDGHEIGQVMTVHRADVVVAKLLK